MVYNETDINFSNFRYNLDDKTYLTESESRLLNDINIIPVIENSRLGVNLVDYSNIENLIEGNQYHSLQDIANSIQEANSLDSLTVAVDDYKLILHPEIVNELNNIVIKPLSKNDPAYIFTEACLDKFMETMDESYIDYLTTIHEYYKDYGKETARKASEATKKALQKEFDSYNIAKDYDDDPTNEDKIKKYNNSHLPMYFGKNALLYDDGKESNNINDPYSKDRKERKKVQKVIKKMYKDAYRNARLDVYHGANKRELNTMLYRDSINGSSPDPNGLKYYLQIEHLDHQGKSLTGKYNKTPLKSKNDSDLDEPIMQTSNLPDLDEILDRKNQAVKKLEALANMDISRQVKYMDKNFIAKQIQHLNNWARKMESKLDTPEKRSIWQKIKALVYKAINKLTKLLGADDKLSQSDLDFARNIGSL